METERQQRFVLGPDDSVDLNQMGGKAGALAALAAADLPIPAWFVVTPAAFDASVSAEQRATLAIARTPKEIDDALGELRFEATLWEEIQTGLGRWSTNSSEASSLLVAVRSSGVDEDGKDHTFAGQFDSFLFVEPNDVPARIVDVWNSGWGERVLAYRRENDLGGPAAPAVLIQRMVDAEVSGVAFSADPISGQRSVVVVSAVYGLGTALVGGDADADTYRVDRSGKVLARDIAVKSNADRRDRVQIGGVSSRAIPAAQAVKPALTDLQILAVADLARRAAAHFGRPQDIEWAIEDGRLYLLQSRPITALSRLPDRDGVLRIWDNSNIVESYSGITTPLTFSFALGAYEGVYREFCRILGVSEEKIEANDDIFRHMLGLVHGRVYYNLLNWYRVLALLPGFTANREFMENMMGVREGLPAEISNELASASGSDKLRDRLNLTKATIRLVGSQFSLPAKIDAFYLRLDEALAEPKPALDLRRLDELARDYRTLQDKLLTRWDAPLINDFFAMIFFGILGKLTQKWCKDENGTLQNDLVSAQGGMISAEPARRILEMARLAVACSEVKGKSASRAPDEDHRSSLVDVLRNEPVQKARVAIRSVPSLDSLYSEYLARFGDRCLDELKLESTTLVDDPTPLLRAVGNTAARLMREPEGQAPLDVDSAPRQAEDRVRKALGRRPFRRLLFSWVLRNARNRVRDRENLRFERTRLFGRVRRIFLEMGRRLHADGVLDEPRDVFYLEVEELLGYIDGLSTCDDLRGLAGIRRARFGEYATMSKPSDRFETRGAVFVGNSFQSEPTVESSEADGDTLRGLGCCPGVVRGPVRVIRDPRGAELKDGEILVAERTDPGWILLFPAAAAILVERGSLLSHSAIVAREMGIPAIVSIPGVTDRLRDGQWVEMDGSSGLVRLDVTSPKDGDVE